MDGQTTDNQTAAKDVAGATVTGTEKSASLVDAFNEAAGSEPDAKPAAGDTADGNTKEIAAQTPAWMEQLPAEIRGNADMMKQLAKFKTVGDTAKAYTELASKLGTSVSIPGKDAKPDEVEAFYEKLGKPKTADGYSMKDKEAEPFRQMAFAADLTDSQAQKLVSYAKTQAAAAETAKQKAYTEAESSLKAEYGAQWNEKLETFKRGIKTFAGPEVAKEIQRAGLNYSPAVVKMFIKLGEMSSEAGTFTKGETAPAEHVPLSKGGMFSFANLKEE